MQRPKLFPMRRQFQRGRMKHFRCIERKRCALIDKMLDVGVTEAEERKWRDLERRADRWEAPYARYAFAELERFLTRNKEKSNV